MEILEGIFYLWVLWHMLKIFLTTPPHNNRWY